MELNTLLIGIIDHNHHHTLSLSDKSHGSWFHGKGGGTDPLAAPRGSAEHLRPFRW